MSQHYPGPQHGFRHPNPSNAYWQPPTPAPKRRRKWPWIVGGLIVVGMIANAVNGPAPAPAPVVTMTPARAPAAASSQAAPIPTVPVVTTVTLPQVKGRNGQIVYAELIELGLTNLTLASRDVDNAVVLLPGNWTAVRIEPGAGERVRSNATVVVTLTKN